MRKLTRSILLASGLALAGGAVAAPALADFRFGINLGPPAYYYAPPGYYYSPYYAAPPGYYYYP